MLPKPRGGVGCWRLENTPNDSWGSLHGTWSGTAAYAAGWKGRAASFDGTKHITDVGALSTFSFVQNTRVYWIAATVKLAATPANTAYYFLGNSLTGANKGFSLAWENRNVVGIANSFRLLLAGVIGGVAATFIHNSAANVWTTTNWTRVVATGDGTTSRLYVNGRLVGSKDFDVDPATGDSTLAMTFGRANHATNILGLVGDLDEIAIGSTYPTTAQVQRINLGMPPL
jgi:hypothetical protein